ncbi:acetyl-CoA carboxylase biotin carboxylase subunit [Chloroflexus sp.]|uniref:acetyl-CoA carboxylase biotin carboxylase subunit n=1 Tax=Chloroflexus sp. TaxID=1904827 RepID=UPI00298EFA42|nr:acetyl-CoA carboxylase biotin carboxylase subunit [Chloroflexus sp.]MCS6888091.1 acetyl-CoA carboxylase biotin carboxylase subunit [Chloroflexus sp.]MDW8402831.1 acetyl-CoA carboxylase biotin carboxylase subunit [Chloroflexus sp.]
MFRTVLVANRGEIALRVMRACRELGLRCVAVYSEADRDAPHVAYADDAYLIGPPSPAESYLNIEAIIRAAKATGAEAIHPGYGFLAENPHFVRAATAAGLVFIGPPAEAMERMGGKTAARREATAAGVPVVPGVLEPVTSAAEVKRLGKEFGYPIAIKAVGGGGGRGLRVVRSPDEVEEAFASARREAEVAFKNGELYVEKYLDDPRHIEIQVLADGYGNAVALGERDCSVQRRHQKLIEECPSPALTPELRAEMGAAAVRLAKAVGYVSAGTLEFLYQDGRYYFLEMNTRIQVEHTVTEMVYGVDLVAAQIRIAQGEKLWLKQEDLVPRGHAIECRINAEDPLHNFRPALGAIGEYREPVGLGVRVDSGVRANYTVPSHYDSLLAKLITWGADRNEAIARMRRALAEYRIEGVTTIIPFHLAALEHPVFVAGAATVNFIPRHPELLTRTAELMPPATPPAPAEPAPEPRRFTVEVNGRRFGVAVFGDGMSLAPAQPAPARGAAPRRASPKKTTLAAPVDGVISPIQGRVVAVRVAHGQQVEAGQVLFIVEAMKMENEITAPHSGTIGEVRVEVGMTVEAGAVLATYQTTA